MDNSNKLTYEQLKGNYNALLGSYNELKQKASETIGKLKMELEQVSQYQIIQELTLMTKFIELKDSFSKEFIDNCVKKIENSLAEPKESKK